MLTEVRADNWAKGINNLDKPNRLPAGYARDLQNLDPSADGVLGKRAGYELVLPCSNARAAYAVANSIIIVDGALVVSYSTVTDEAETIGTVSASGPVAGAAMNGQLYLATLTDRIRIDAGTVKPWAIVEPAFNVEVITGGLAAGLYRVAATATGADGEESGASSAIIQVPDGGGLRLTSDDPRTLRAYCSAPNSATPYYQGLLYAGGMAITTVDDSQESLTTDGLVPMPFCTEYASYHGVILGRFENLLFVSMPMSPHLTDPVSGFFQFGGPVTVIAVTDGGVFVAADKTYFLAGLETSTPSQRVVIESGAVEGTAVTLPDGSATWFTRYGQAVGSASGAVTLPNMETFAPDVAAHGAAGVVEHGGNRMVVTTMRGITQANNLTAGDFADLET